MIETKETLDEFESSKIGQTDDCAAKFVVNVKIVDGDFKENQVLIYFENFANLYGECD